MNTLLFGAVLFIALCLGSVCDAAKPNTTESYPNTLVLKSPDALYLYWKHTNQDITFELHMKNTSMWVAFGVLNSTFADFILTYWLNDEGVGHFSDWNMDSSGRMAIDTVKNWMPIDAFKFDEYSVFKFKRNIKLNCDGNVKNEDLDIGTDSNKIGYILGVADPAPGANLFSNITSQDVKLLADGTYNCPSTNPKPTFTSTPTDNYANYQDLVDEGAYRLYWNYTSTDFIAEIHVRTTGWVGFGFSPNGGMAGSDMVIGWVDSKGVANFTDRYASGKVLPTVDKNQNYKLLFSAERNGYTIFKFSRPIKLCDSDDMTISVILF
jgi:hypothetical protein